MNSNFRLEKNKTEDFRFRHLIEQLVGQWHWFIIALVLALIAAWLWIKLTPATFKLSAVIMVDSRPKTGNMPSGTSTLLDPSMLPDNNNNAEKTVQVLKSARLIRDVIRRLKLNNTYSFNQGFRRQDLYNLSPVTVDFAGKNLPGSAFRLAPDGSNGCKISDVNVGGSDISWTKTVLFGDTLSTPMGTIVVKRADNPDAGLFTQSIAVTHSDLDSITTEYRDDVAVEVDNEKAEVIKISLIADNYKKTEDFINMLIAVYNEYTLEDKNKAAQNTANFIRERVGLIGVELGDVDKEIEQFKKTNNLTDIESESDIYLNSQNEFRSNAAGLTAQIGVADHMIGFLSNPGNRNEVLPANSGGSDNSIGQMILSYNTVLANRNKLLENSSSASQAVKDLDVSLATARAGLLASFQNQKYTLQAQLKAMNAQQSNASGHLRQLPEQERGLQSIARQQQIKEQLYLYLLQKREENALNLALSTSNIRVIDYAEGSHKPVAPNKTRIASIALVIGLVLPGGVIYLVQQLNSKVRSKKDVETYTTVPIVGEIPQGDKSRSMEVVTHDPGKDNISEAFRIVRSNLRFVLPSGKEKVMMITSSQSGEGKTFISFNLALSLAVANQRVILVNTDIRKKSNAPSSFNNGGSGLTSYLSGSETNVKNLIHKGKLHPNLDVISSGAIPPNPAELLMSDRLDRLIETLKQDYDYVILDNVPMLLVADAVIVSRVIDLTIYVIREGVLDRRVLPEIQKYHQTSKLKNMVILLNGGRQAGRWGYGYGYGYGYGNGSGKLHHKKTSS